MRRRRRPLLAVVPALLTLLVALTAGPPASGAAEPSITGAPCAPGVGVTVVVDYQNLGGVEIGCAPGAQTDGLSALRNAGFTINDSGGPVAGTVCQIRSVPASGHPACWYDGFWGYWKSDGAQPWQWSSSPAGAGPLGVDRVEGWSWTSPVPADYSGRLPRVAVADLAAPDATEPVITVTAAPSGTTASATASIAFTVDDPAAVVEYSLDGGPWTPASSPVQLAGLAPGAHTVQLRATDPASNVGVATVGWTVAGSRDCATGPSLPDLGILDGRDALPVRSADRSAVEVAVLADLDADPASAAYTVTDLLDLSTYVGQQIRVLARIADDPCADAPTFDAVYDVRSAYAPRWTLDDAPGAPSAAVPATSTDIKAWPSAYANYAPGPNVNAGFQNPSSVVGKTGLVVLGDRGTIDLAFARPIADGPGADLAVFENSFPTSAAAQETDFLELGRVAVSSDGAHWATFDSASRRTAPVGAYAGQSAAEIGGLAGKDLSGRGTPFDLVNLRNSAQVRAGVVDLGAIRYVRVIDVVGDGNDLDSFGRPLYDPYPTSGSGGFDLTGVAALNLAPAPVVAVTGAPQGATRERSASIEFTVAPASGPLVECRQDQGEWVECASPLTVDALDDGEHTIEIRAGWGDAEDWGVASATWIVDTQAPSVTITSAPAALTGEADASIEFDVDDGSATLLCAVDGAAAAACASPLALTGLAAGPHSVVVTAADAAGNVGEAMVLWTVAAPAGGGSTAGPDDPRAAEPPTAPASGTTGSGAPLARTGAPTAQWGVRGAVLLLAGAGLVVGAASVGTSGRRC